ncbi:Ton complex subunit ExbD [Hyphomicrobium sp. 1Nfss2.1]|uniref:TonB system transport protein ExbD n=1 Tax=Hyphomicrobium sp. 1Nfss2.1 TaxID=3413936 RepID=UPI003C7E45E2
MAGSLNARDDSDELEVNHEINVTPFIDVMLVLLIIFMVAAPLSTVDVHVDLPVSNAQPAPRPSEPIFLTVKADLSLAFGNEPIARGALKSALDGKSQGNRDERVFVRADKTVDFGDLMQVMNELRSAGYLKIALVGLETATPSAAADPGAAAQPAATPAPGQP